MSPEFEQFKDSYFRDIRENYMAGLLDGIVRQHPLSRVLDVGCGNGLFGGYLKEKTGCRIVGVDASEFALKEARKAGFDEVHLCPDLDSRALPFPDGTFDFVLCKDVLEHLLVPLHLLKETRRLLKPGGLLLSHVPNHFTLPARLRFVFGNDIDTYSFFPSADEWEFPHVRFFTYQGFVCMHQAAGLALEKDLSPYFAVRVPKFWRLPGYGRLAGVLHRAFPSSFTTAYTALFRAAR